MELPSRFPPRSVFFDVDGDSVSFADGKAMRWSADGNPEPMSAASAARGIHISEDRFRTLAKVAT